MTLERRTPLRRTGPPARTSPLRAKPETTRAWRDRSARPLPPVSAKGRARNAAATAAGARAKERDGWACQAAPLVPSVRCSGPLDPQHVIPRSTRRDLVADVRNIVAVCRAHHRWIDDHPSAARSVGLHGFADDDLAALAARRRT